MMFVQQIRRCLVVYFSNNNSVVVSICKSHTCFSLSLLHYYSTSASSSSRGKQHLVTTNPSVSELLQKYHFSPESASQVASALTRLKNPAKYDSILTFLIENGFSNTQLEKILKYRPTLLSANPDKVIKPKIKIFQDLGFSANDTADIITNDPDILYRSLNNRVIPSLSAMKGLLGSSVEVAKILKISGWFLKYDIEKTMLPNVAFLKSCGIDMDQISWLMYNFPRSLLCKPESMTKFVERIDEMGISRSSKMFIHAIRVLGSMTNETWELKLKAFQNLGFSEDDIVAAFRKAPQVFCASEDKMRKLKEVLLATRKYDILSIINHPTSLICSIEKRYKPRLQVLGILDSKNLIKDWPSFAALYKMPDDRFFKKYVGPYSDEVGDLFLLNSASSSKRSVKLIPSA
ncbi:hypothetical protein BUALT_Bualt15G0127700 [Buddleja alternifolia]|uniref:Mitochondrial transcription termination factor n=1 Tax=Buddleja alternifolia TaxID=168488 RepID=A0AAV6WNS9_9LAMI|nr:hypothetical protein BUALT_Bualt15G0127700 [Buddleja alternifolia]